MPCLERLGVVAGVVVAGVPPDLAVAELHDHGKVEDLGGFG
jgi:hypothetical protein